MQKRAFLLHTENSNVLIGKGQSGSQIYTALQKSSKKKVAVKEILKKGKTVAQIEDIRDMISMYQLAQHHNVVRLEDYFESKDKFYLCLELHQNRSLYDYVQNNEIDERKARELAIKIAKALEHLHSNGILLRNLSADGILMAGDPLEKKEYPNLIPRIAKLNKARVMGKSDAEYCVGIEGDIRYCAPEVVEGKSYNHKADCWSYGVILFYVMTGVLPFDHTNNKGIKMSRLESKTEKFTKNVEYKICNSEPNYQLIREQGFTEECIVLVSKLLNRDPELRLTMKATNIHQWFLKNIDYINKSDIDKYELRDSPTFM